MSREWAISDDDYKKVLYHLHEIDAILEKNRMRDRLLKIKKLLDGARLRDPKFKNNQEEIK